MNLNKQAEEQTDSAQQEQPIRLKDLDSRDLVFDLREPVFPNTIAFNGEIVSDFYDVGAGYVAFNLLAGKERLEMPLILIDGDIKEISSLLKKEDKIAGIGILEKMQGQFVIKARVINKIPTSEEIKKLI